MQDRYVGDVGDFAKYALLRSIADCASARLGIVWCLFHDEFHNLDGRHTGYLQRLEFRSLDPELHDVLSRIINVGRRSIAEISRARLFGPETVYFDQPIAATAIGTDRRIRESYRREWLTKALSVTAHCDVVFFDPDNGFETPSVPIHSLKAGKYVYLDELNLFWERGQSLIVYHHLNRSASVEQQTHILRKRLLAEFSDAVFVRSILFRRGSCRHFWILAQRDHAANLKSRVDAMLDSGWRGHFEVE